MRRAAARRQAIHLLGGCPSWRAFAASVLLVGLGSGGLLWHTAPQAQTQAATQVGAAAWSELSATEQQMLAPLKPSWARLDEGQRAKWVEMVPRMSALPAAERQRVQERMAAWAALSPEQRAQARIQFQDARQVPPEARRERWEQYQSLPAAERAALGAVGRDELREGPPSVQSSRDGDKRNTVPPSALTPGIQGRPVAPAVVESRTGATTSLINAAPQVPLHQQAGLPKITADRGFVDPATLLPRRGPQGAAMTPPQPTNPPANPPANPSATPAPANAPGRAPAAAANPTPPATPAAAASAASPVSGVRR